MSRFEPISLKFRGQDLLLVSGESPLGHQLETIVRHCPEPKLAEALGASAFERDPALRERLESQLRSRALWFAEARRTEPSTASGDVTNLSDLIDPAIPLLDPDVPRDPTPAEPDPTAPGEPTAPAPTVFPDADRVLVFQVVEASGLPLTSLFELADAGSLSDGNVREAERVTKPVATKTVRLELSDVRIQVPENA